MAVLNSLEREINDKETAALKELAGISTKLSEALKLLNNPAFTPDEIELEHLAELIDARLDEQEVILAEYQTSGNIDN